MHKQLNTEERMFGKKKVAMLVAEFIGTAVLVLSVLSVRSSGIGYSFFVALGAGLAVAALSFMLSESSGAQFNPALTIGLWVSRKVKTLPGILYVIVQLLGAWAAYGLFKYFTKSHLPASGGSYMGRVLVAEAAGTFVFAFAWAAAAAQKFDGVRRAATLGGGFALAIIVSSLAAVGTGVGFANPALALGSHAWNIWGTMGWGTYVLGPVIGGIVGVGLYHLLFAAGGKTKAPAKAIAKKK
jgi:glycerol uptake facilitator-like aquaporin